MATLKHVFLDKSQRTHTEYPWMKIHGNIEASYIEEFLAGISEYPWMKIHGNIEAGVPNRKPKQVEMYPWMKIHGNIEA